MKPLAEEMPDYLGNKKDEVHFTSLVFLFMAGKTDQSWTPQERISLTL